MPEDLEILGATFIGLPNDVVLKQDVSYPVKDPRQPGTTPYVIVEYIDTQLAHSHRSIITDLESFFHINHIPVSENQDILMITIKKRQHIRVLRLENIKDAVNKMSA